MALKVTTKESIQALMERWRTVDITTENIADFWHEVNEAVEGLPPESPTTSVHETVNNNHIDIENGVILETVCGDIYERKIYVGALGIQQYNEEQCAVEALDVTPPKIY